MKELCRFTTLAEAEQVCELLRSHGIAAHLNNENAARMLSHMLPALGHVGVYVDDERLEEAGEFLRSFSSPAQETYEEERAANDESVSGLAKRAVLASVIGLTFLPLIATVYSFGLILKTMGRHPDRRSGLLLGVAFSFNLLGVAICAFLVRAILE